MSWQATAYVKALTHGPGGEPLTRDEKLVLYTLSDYYDDAQGCAWPSGERLAAECLLSPRSLWRVLGRLVAKGVLVRVARRAEDGRQATNVYRFPALDGAPSAPPRREAEQTPFSGTASANGSTVGTRLQEGPCATAGTWSRVPKQPGTVCQKAVYRVPPHGTQVPNSRAAIEPPHARARDEVRKRANDDAPRTPEDAAPPDPPPQPSAGVQLPHGLRPLDAADFARFAQRRPADRQARLRELAQPYAVPNREKG